MQYQVRKATDANGDRLTRKTIALKVRADETWSPAARFKRNYEKSASCIHLDALTGTVRGEQLLRQMEEVKARHNPVL
jgi:hypothetical protein